MTSKTKQEIIAIHILTNIPWSKDKQTMKFGELIEYKMRNIFLGNILLGKSYTKCCAEASLRPYHKKSKLSISLDQQYEML